MATFVLDKKGSMSSRSRNAWNLLASDDEWAAPIMAEVGPDGNVWVIDWYNFIIQHNLDARGLQDRQGQRLSMTPISATRLYHRRIRPSAGDEGRGRAEASKGPGDAGPKFPGKFGRRIEE